MTLETEIRKKSLEPQKANEALREGINERKRIDAEFKKTTDMFHAILDNSMAVISIKDIHSKYVFANKCYAELFKVDMANFYYKGS